jgi:ATP/maltotriose-dependent transcriptional regulator MalT
MQTTRLARPRINARLQSAARFPVTLIVAPAGFGKSIALRDFLESAQVDAVRYDVRREDGTLLAFVRRLSEALVPVAPSALAAFPAMQERILAAEEPVRQLSDWFAEHLKECKCTIVIDDLHYASTDPASIALLADLIERTGERIRWIIAARTDAGLPIGTWVAYGRMDYPIGEDELRFTTDEALATASETASELEPQEVEALRQLTEGWPVALTIAMRTRTHSRDLRTAAFGTREMVYRYLAEQVFAALTISQRAFALSTSVFSSFDGGIAQALGANPAFLQEVRAKIAFLNEVSPGEYRYHDLFRDFLETELRRSGEREFIRALCDGASLLEQRDDYAGALVLYTKARANEHILRLVQHHGFSLFEQGASELLSSALTVLPENLRQNDATALGLQAMIDASRGHFEIAEQRFLRAIDRADDIALRLTLVHRYAIELVRNGKDCVSFLQPFAGDTSLTPDQRAPLLGTLATGYVGGDRIEEALATIEAALAALQPHSDDHARARLFQQAAHVFQRAGVKDRAQTYAQLAVEYAVAHNLYELAARAYSVLYNLKYEEDDPPSTLAILEKISECGRKGASSQIRLYSLLAIYDIQAEAGDQDALVELDAALRQDQSALPSQRLTSLMPALALRAAWSRNFSYAYELLRDTASQQGSPERAALRNAETALYAMAADLQTEADAAIQDAEAALKDSPSDSRRTIRARLLLALADMVRGRWSNAHRRLSEAERALKPGMIRLRALCDAARTAYRVEMQQSQPQSFTEAAERLRQAHFGGFAMLLEVLPLGSASPGGYGGLTPAEREILQLLAKGASTKEVANKTGRSPHTVDTHIRSICRKLGCSGRREAVALATSQGWVIA